MKRTRIIVSMMVAVILASCSTGNMVTNGKGIQKRKYNDGFYVSFGHKSKKSTDQVVTEETVQYALEEQTEANNLSKSESETIASLSKPTEKPETEFTLATEEISMEAINTVEETNGSVEPLSVLDRGENEDKVIKPLRKYAPKMIYTKVAENNSSSGDAMIILLVILAIIIPPLAVFIFEGATTRFWIDLILAIIGIGVGWWLLGGGIGYLCALAAVIYALLIVLSVI